MFPFTVTVEGNIGCGKTTFLKYFEDLENSKPAVYYEPLDKWRNFNGWNLLDLLYQDARKWAMQFQLYALKTMYDQHREHTIDTPVKIMERSMISSHYCFSEQLARNRSMTPSEFVILHEIFKTFKRDVHVNLIIYLRTSPKVAYERVKKRNRPEERNITFDYLDGLHQLHEKWLMGKKTHREDNKFVLIIDADRDISALDEEYKTLAKKLSSKIDQKQCYCNFCDLCSRENERIASYMIDNTIAEYSSSSDSSSESDSSASYDYRGTDESDKEDDVESASVYVLNREFSSCSIL